MATATKIVKNSEGTFKTRVGSRLDRSSKSASSAEARAFESQQGKQGNGALSYEEALGNLNKGGLTGSNLALAQQTLKNSYGCGKPVPI